MSRIRFTVLPLAAFLFVTLLTHTGVPAAPVWVTVDEAAPAGADYNRANVSIRFKDGAEYVFDVGFLAASTTGLGLLDIIEAGTSLTTVRGDFGFGVFVDGIGYDGHANTGYAGGDDWWHYWTADAPTPTWTSPMFGASDRVVTDGSWDGWVYGSASAPVPEPAVGALATGAAGVLLLRRRRGTSTTS